MRYALRTWPEGVEPTPEQWSEWFMANEPDARLDIARRVLEANREAALCWQAGHDGLLHEVEHLRASVREAWSQEPLVAALARERRYRLAWRSARRYRVNVKRLTTEYLANRP